MLAFEHKLQTYRESGAIDWYPPQTSKEMDRIYPTAATKPSISDLAVAGKYSSAAVTASTGVITVTMGAAGTVNAAVAGKTITFTPPVLTAVGTTLTFACASGNLAQKFLPKSCSGT